MCAAYLPTRHCRLPRQQMQTEPLCKLQDSHPEQEVKLKYINVGPLK